MKLHTLAPALLGALSAHAAWITITSLPVTITQPGDYYFVSDIYEPTLFQVPAITVNAPGPVVIDLRGFALVGPEYNANNSAGVLIQSNDVTVQNGSIEGFLEQVGAGSFYQPRRRPEFVC